MRRTLASVLVAVAAVSAAALAASSLQRFNLHYETRPLDESGAVDQGEAPTGYWYKDHRSRIDSYSMEGGRPELQSSFVMDCDSSRMLMIDWRNETVTETTFEEFQAMQRQAMEMAARYGAALPGAPAGAAAGESRPGGTVEVTTAWSDTLDDPRFGLTVRRVGMVETRTASADACTPGDSRSEVRRWITELNPPICVPPFDVTAFEAGGFAPPAPSCEDRVVERTTGRPRHGFVLREEHRRISLAEDKRGDSGHITSGYEVTTLSLDSLADSLFAAPRGFERQSLPSLGDMAGAGAIGAPGEAPPKAAGIVRVAVALRLPAGAPVVPAQAAEDVVAWISGQPGYDAVRLAALDADAARAEAAGVDADYVLFYDVGKAEAKVSGRGLLGGAIGGALGERAAGGALHLEVRGRWELSRLDGGRVARDEFEEEERAEDPAAQTSAVLVAAARAALEALR
ncbi:MAG TPA: hypothetical protein VM778_09070 [Gemmatimonadota bacterium]|nr:hypothetical protein [Gemmatimonadota bacterium]